MSNENAGDPRDLIVQKKYFSLRPRPLEQWLWRHGVPSSAERVFWLHWQEGMINRDWCSEIPLRRVATQCDLDVSSVTRAYQLLVRLGLIRRQDPGRDPSRPFARAIAVTEVRIPGELMQELHCHPDRARQEWKPVSDEPSTPISAPSQLPRLKTPTDCSTAARDPFEGMSGRARVRALGQLLDLMSVAERRQYADAMRTDSPMAFDTGSALRLEQQETVLHFLAIVSRRAPAVPSSQSGARHATSAPRKLSVFELARIRREIQHSGVPRDAAELLREVVWSVEEGALRRFPTLHATRIALKKIRENAWTRPNRMPPHWSRAISHPEPSELAAHIETCRTA